MHCIACLQSAFPKLQVIFFPSKDVNSNSPNCLLYRDLKF